jgi:hypothetical protein
MIQPETNAGSGRESAGGANLLPGSYDMTPLNHAAFNDRLDIGSISSKQVPI